MTTEAPTRPYWVVKLGGYYDDMYGSSCGDYSVGTEASNSCTWMSGVPGEPYVTATVYYYVEAWLGTPAAGDDQQLDAGQVEEYDGDPEMLAFGVTERAMWLAHTDLDDPGGTEVDSDIDDTSTSHWFRTLEEANACARQLARNENWAEYYPENWRNRR